MSLRRQKTKDSLDLLLDTMCNTFGGIILIAILVALISGGRLQLAVPASTEDVSKLRAGAQEELSRLQRVAADLQERIAAGGLAKKVEMARQKEEAEARVVSLQKRLASAQGELKKLEDIKPSERRGALEAELEREDEQMNDLNRAQSRLNADLEGRRRVLAGVEQQTRSVLEAFVLRLRYPRERPTGKGQFYVLVKNRRLYPTFLPDGERNRQTIDWTELGGDSIARPRAGMGVDPILDPGQADRLFSQLNPGSRYVAFVVFEDSFAAFSAAQQLCLRRGLEYGWVPSLKQEAVFSTSGTSPLPQ